VTQSLGSRPIQYPLDALAQPRRQILFLAPEWIEHPHHIVRRYLIDRLGEQSLGMLLQKRQPVSAMLLQGFVSTEQLTPPGSTTVTWVTVAVPASWHIRDSGEVAASVPWRDADVEFEWAHGCRWAWRPGDAGAGPSSPGAGPSSIGHGSIHVDSRCARGAG